MGNGHQKGLLIGSRLELDASEESPRKSGLVF